MAWKNNLFNVKVDGIIHYCLWFLKCYGLVSLLTLLLLHICHTLRCYRLRIHFLFACKD